MKLEKLNIAAHLKADEDIREFLRESAANATTEEFIHALNTAARAKGMTKVAQEAGVTVMVNKGGRYTQGRYRQEKMSQLRWHEACLKKKDKLSESIE